MLEKVTYEEIRHEYRIRLPNWPSDSVASDLDQPVGSAPVLLAGMVVGLVIGLLQAVTQIQEQTVAFVPKIVSWSWFELHAALASARCCNTRSI